MKGKKVTGFTNSEEEAVGKTKVRGERGKESGLLGFWSGAEGRAGQWRWWWWFRVRMYSLAVRFVLTTTQKVPAVSLTHSLQSFSSLLK